MTGALLFFTVVMSLTSCGLDMPKEVPSSYETMTVTKTDIEVTITPQVSGQLMQICVNEGQMVKKGQTLFVIDSRNAQLSTQ